MTDLMRFQKHTNSTLYILLGILLGMHGLSWAEEAEQPASETTSTAPEVSEPLTVPKRTFPQPQALRFSSLESEISLTTDQEWVDLGTNTFSAKGLLTLHQNKTIRGTILLYPDSGTHQDWPRITHAVRNSLPSTGWNTLSLPIPMVTTLNIPERTLPSLKLLKPTPQNNETDTPETESSPEENSDTASTELATEGTENTPEETGGTENAEQDTTPPEQTEETTSPPETFSSEEVFALNSSQTLAAVQRAQALGDHPIVILGVGDGSVWAARAAQTLQNQARVYLMMIDPYPVKNSEQNVSSLIGQLTLPVMDLALPESRASKLSENTQTQQLRQAIANRAEKPFYYTARIPQQAWSRNQSDWLVRYIDGRLRTLIAIQPEEESMPDEPTQPLSNIPPGGQG